MKQKKEILNTNVSVKKITDNVFVIKADEKLNNGLRESYAKELFKYAESSLRVALLCFESQEIPDCIFNLQQCIEKLVKSELYGAGISYAVREIGHNPHKPYEEIFYNQVVAGLDEKDEKGFMICKNCKSCAETLPNFFTRVNQMKPILEEIESYADDFIEHSFGLYEAIIKQYTMLFLSYMFYNTEQNARYPNIKEGTITTPSELYPKGLLKQLPEIIKLIRKIIRLQGSPLIASLLDSAK